MINRIFIRRPLPLRAAGLSLSLRLSPHHFQELPGSYFEKNSATLIRLPRSQTRVYLLTKTVKSLELHQPVTSQFQVLFNALPGYFSTFPRGTSPLSVSSLYLGLEAGAPIFTPKQMDVTQNAAQSPPLCLTRLSLFVAGRSSPLQARKGNLMTAAHHISRQLPSGIQFALCGFQSPLLTASHVGFFSCRY